MSKNITEKEKKFETFPPVNSLISPFILRPRTPPIYGRYSNETKMFQTTVIEYFEILINFFFYLFVCPFKVVNVGPNAYDRIKLESPKFQKIICYSLHIFNAIYHIPAFIKGIAQTNIKNNPTHFYTILFTITGLFMTTNFSLLCLRNYKLKSVLMQAFQLHQNAPEDNLLKTKKWLVRGMVCAAVVIVIVFCIRESTLDFSSWSKFVRSGSNAFFVHIGCSENNVEFSEPSPLISTVLIGLTVLHFIFTVFNYILAIFSEVCVLFLGFIMFQIGRDFIKIRDSSELTLDQLSTCYQDMKSFVDNLNSTFGSLILFLITSAVPYYGLYLIEIFCSSSWERILETVYFMILYSAALLFAADGHRNIQQLCQYIFRHRKRFSADKDNIPIFVSEITNSQVGLKGLGFFTLTYGFLGSTIGIVTTHVIINLQFKTSPGITT